MLMVIVVYFMIESIGHGIEEEKGINTVWGLLLRHLGYTQCRDRTELRESQRLDWVSEIWVGRV